MRPFTRDVYIVAAKRSPFGSFGGTLKSLSATDLGTAVAKACLQASGVSPSLVDDVVFGNVLQTSADAIYLARHIGLRAGVPQDVPGLTVNRLCGSGFQALISAAQNILTGGAAAVLAGGTESMSQAPHVIRGARWGLQLGRGDLEDLLWSCLTDTYVDLPMGMTAENLAVQYGIDQAQVDDYAVETQRRHAAAMEGKRFEAELVPIEVPGRKATQTLTHDEHARPTTTHEGLKKLPKAFKRDGVIHAGAASGICDGAAALLIASGDFVERQSLQPLARIVGWGISGCDPTIMGIGPVPAIQRCLKSLDATLDDFALIEVNEAFAPQVLAVQKALDIPTERFNVNGGAIAMGHPLGASGARIVTHLVHELRRRGERFGLGSACIGGGQGIAVAVEAV